MPRNQTWVAACILTLGCATAGVDSGALAKQASLQAARTALDGGCAQVGLKACHELVDAYEAYSENNEPSCKQHLARMVAANTGTDLTTIMRIVQTAASLAPGAAAKQISDFAAFMASADNSATPGAPVAASLVAGQCPQAGCGKDTDCKGDRVCVHGECVDPDASAPQAGEPRTVRPRVVLLQSISECDVDPSTCDARCASGDFASCNTFGRLQSFKSDHAGAGRAFETACSGGLVEGCHNLALYLYTGAGVQPDKSEAFRLFRDACAHGSGASCVWSGWIAESGAAATALARELYDRGCTLQIPDACERAAALAAAVSASAR